MKLYVIARNKFIKMAIVEFIFSIITIYFFRNEALGNFFLGIFASTIIIVFQYHLSAKVEESKLLMSKIKKIRKLSLDLQSINFIALEYYSNNREKAFLNFKNSLTEIFSINNELQNMQYLSKKTKLSLRKITNQINKLEYDTYIILKKYDLENSKNKILYFIEIYNIIKEFDFNNFYAQTSELGKNIDWEEFYHKDFEQQKGYKLEQELETTSMNIYNKKLEEKYKIEYEILNKKHKHH